MSFSLLLLFFVARQLLRLWRERSRRYWVAATSAASPIIWRITAIPAILVAMFAVSIIDYSLRGWFADRISTAVNESVEAASAYFEEHSRSVRGQILAMANDLNREASRLARNPNQLNDYISSQTALRNLSEAVIIDGTGQILLNRNLHSHWPSQGLMMSLLPEPEKARSLSLHQKRIISFRP